MAGYGSTGGGTALCGCDTGGRGAEPVARATNFKPLANAGHSRMGRRWPRSGPAPLDPDLDSELASDPDLESKPNLYPGSAPS